MPASPGILIVDDEEAITESLALTLATEYQVYTAKSGAEGLEILDREEVGVIIELFEYDPIFLQVSAGMLAIGLLSGLLPAIQAYRSDVAQNLTPTS